MTDVTSRPQQFLQVPFGSDGETWQQILESQGLSNGRAAPVSGPTGDPHAMYPTEPGLETRAFELPASGLSDAKRRKALSSMELYLANRRDHMLGYQVTQDMNGYPTDLSRFMEDHLNNIGDPFQSGGYKPNTKIAERAVLDYYAALWNAQWPHDPRVPESYWGYMLSMGSTEGNMYALWNARDYLRGKALIESTEPTTFGALRYVQAAPHVENLNAFHPVAFFSEDTHYSFAKAVRVLNVDTFHSAGEALYPGKCPLTDAEGRPLKGGRRGPLPPRPLGQLRRRPRRDRHRRPGNPGQVLRRERAPDHDQPQLRQHLQGRARRRPQSLRAPAADLRGQRAAGAPRAVRHGPQDR